MTVRPKALIAWSSGKDSAWALHEMRRTGDCEIVGALTTVTDTFGRVSMHGVRQELLNAQLAAAGLPAVLVRIPFPCPNEVYEARMAAALADAKQAGVTRMVFGDLFLQDVRTYRETEARRHRHRADVSAVGPADRRTGARDDRGGCRDLSDLRRPQAVAEGVRRPPA